MNTKEGHLCSEFDWLNFFWGLWAGPPPAAGATDSRFSVNQINNIWSEAARGDDYNDPADDDLYVWCAPITTTGEVGWTCKPFPWPWVKPANSGYSTPTGWYWSHDVEVYMATRYTRGKTWNAVLDSAAALYEETSEDKYRHFESMGTRAGVTF